MNAIKNFETKVSIFEVITKMMRIIFLLVVFSTSASACQEDVLQLAARLESLERDVKILMTSFSKILKMDLINNLKKGTNEEKAGMNVPRLNETDLEERVTILETQMVNVQDDVTVLSADLSDLDEDVEDQFIVIEEQITLVLNEILQLEDVTDTLNLDIEDFEGTIDELIANDVSITTSIEDLDSRVTALELLNGTVENITHDVTELEVELNRMNMTVEGLVSNVATAEEAITALHQSDEDQDVQLTDLDTRLSQLELDDTVAFHVVLVSYSSVPEESVLVFSAVNVNIGNGYSTESGIFTVPSGCAGLYYFYAHLMFNPDESSNFNIRHNGLHVCDITEVNSGSTDFGMSSCGAVMVVEEGKLFKHC